jgi:hypothetical protein
MDKDTKSVEFVIQILHMEVVLASGEEAHHREAWARIIRV